MKRSDARSLWAVLAVLGLAATASSHPGDVSPTVETQAVFSTGDAADDICVWIHPTDPSQSLVIGTDKKRGLETYDLSGNLVQEVAEGHFNNVDLRYGFPLGGTEVALVATSNRVDDSIVVYAVDPVTRTLNNVTSRQLKTGITLYGCCLYRSPISGELYFFGNSKGGSVEQWWLFDDGAGKVDAKLVRSFTVGTACEGSVADDHYGWYFVSEEAVGIWRYGAEPGDGDARYQVDSTGTGGHLQPDVEGLALYQTLDGGGYLIASSQGADNYVVYHRAGGQAYVTSFAIIAGNGIDGVGGTDGIDVTNFPLGKGFPLGTFIAQDDNNDTGNQNFKLVPWESIANTVQPPLSIDTLNDPRDGGSSPVRFHTNPLGECQEAAYVSVGVDGGSEYAKSRFLVFASFKLTPDFTDLLSPMVLIFARTDSVGEWLSPQYYMPPGTKGMTVYARLVIENLKVRELKWSPILPTRIY